MRRFGPLLFSAAIVVLCAGIVSTRSDAWKKPAAEALDIPLDVEGVTSLEIIPDDLGNVIIAQRSPGIRSKPPEWAREDEDSVGVTVTRAGDRLRLDHEPDERLWGEVEVTIPPGLSSLSGSRLVVEAEVNAGTLRMDGASLRWNGDADALDMDALPGAMDPNRNCQQVSRVNFVAGSVQVLRVSIERGELVLGDLSRVGRIEVHAGADVQLTVRHIDDVGRIEIHPFGGMASSRASARARLCPF